MRIEWDEPKRRANVAKHGYDFTDVPAGFFDTALVLASRSGRAVAVGWFEGHHVTVVFAPLGSEAVSIISMRRDSRRERTSYEARYSADH